MQIVSFLEQNVQGRFDVQISSRLGKPCYTLAMKKLSITILAALALCLPLFSSPLATVASLAPLALYSGSMKEEVIDLGESYAPSAIAMPLVLAESGFEPSGLLSPEPKEVLQSLIEGMALLATIDDLYVEEGRGVVTLAPDFSGLAEGRFSFSIVYDDVTLMYNAASVTDIGSIDGSSLLTVDLAVDPVFTLAAESDTSAGGKGSVELSVMLDIEALDAYLAFSGMEIGTIRHMLVGMLASEIPEELLSAVLGKDASGADAGVIISLLEEKDMLDLLDALIFILIASEDYRLSESDLLTLCFQPVLSIDGEVVDLDIQRLIKDFARAAYVMT